MVENPAFLSIDTGRLKIERPELKPVFILPKDIAVLVLHHHSITLTHAVMNHLAQSGTVILSTDQKHMPCALQFPLLGNVQLVSRLEAQIFFRDSELCDELWRQLISCRFMGQAALLEQTSSEGVKMLERMAQNVKPGDPENLESQAARHFWKYWLDEPHKRNKQGATDNINALLNFGYAILRSFIARSVVAAGLNPALGIHHKSSENPNNLVDDLIEPYRYLVEKQVTDNLLDAELNPETKKIMASIVNLTVKISGNDHRMASAIQTTVSSFVNVLTNKQENLELPEFQSN